MSLLEINAKDAEAKLQVATKFHLVIISIIFGAVSLFLYNNQEKLHTKQEISQKEFREYVIKENSVSQSIINDLIKIVTENTVVLKDTREYLNENKIYIKPKK